MKKALPLIVLLLSLIVLYSCHAPQSSSQASLNVADFGLSTEEDAIPALRKVLAYAKQHHIKKILFPKGTYHFHDDFAEEFYMTVSNNTNGLKRVAFPLMDFQDLEIDAQDAEFMFHGLLVPFALENASDIRLKNFSIDFSQPFYGQAKVIAVNAAAQTFDIKIGGEWSYELHDQNLWVQTAYGLVNIGKNLWFDPQTKAPVYNVNAHKLDPWNYWVDDKYEAKELSPGILRITNKVSKLPEVGWIWVFKGNGKVRRIPAFRVFNAKNISLENIQLHHCGTMGLIGEKSENIRLTKVKVQLKPETQRMITTTADATHFVNCKGEIRFQDCVFENMLDDATNVHGIYTRISKKVDAYTLGVNLMHHEQWGFQFASPGDSLLISDNQSFKAVQALKVAAVRFLNEEYMEIRFEQPLSEQIQLGFGVENLSWQADLSMTDCTVRQNRARSILISTRGKVLVENNYFSSMMGAISIAGDMNFWYESGPVAQVLIRNNTFVNHCSSGKGNHVIMVNPNIPERGIADHYFHKHVIIDSNLFRTFDRGILYSEYTDHLAFTNNRIEQSLAFSPLYPEYAVIKVESSQEIDISGNHYQWDQAADVEVDSSSLQSLLFERNTGFEPQVKVVNEATGYEVK